MSGSAAEKSAINGVRTAFGVGGVLSILAGLLILWQPQGSAAFVTVVIAIYAIVGGLVYAGLGIFSKAKGGWARLGHIVLGLIFIAGGVVALFNLQQATAWLAVFVGILVGILWIVEGIVSLSTLGDAASKGWTIFFAIISIIAGLVPRDLAAPGRRRPVVAAGHPAHRAGHHPDRPRLQVLGPRLLINA